MLCVGGRKKTGGSDDITQMKNMAPQHTSEILVHLFLGHKYCGPSHMKLKTRDALQRELELKEVFFLFFFKGPAQFQSFSWVTLNISLNLQK